MDSQLRQWLLGMLDRELEWADRVEAGEAQGWSVCGPEFWSQVRRNYHRGATC